MIDKNHTLYHFYNCLQIMYSSILTHFIKCHNNNFRIYSNVHIIIKYTINKCKLCCLGTTSTSMLLKYQKNMIYSPVKK
jgi:hypothetical protein